jgi:hypothetical protein
VSNPSTVAAAIRALLDLSWTDAKPPHHLAPKGTRLFAASKAHAGECANGQGYPALRSGAREAQGRADRSGLVRATNCAIYDDRAPRESALWLILLVFGLQLLFPYR